MSVPYLSLISSKRGCTISRNASAPDFVKSEKGIDLLVSGAFFFFYAGPGQISPSTADIRSRISSLVTFQTI
jgi:hypothetical protein